MKQRAVSKQETQQSEWRWLGGLSLLTLLVFGDVLFFGGSRVLGSHTTDLYSQFVAWREFGFAELAKGNLALWNPHIYGGAPYFGGMQAALLYPPNWVFLILPLARAVNWSIALHMWALGAFMFLWMRQRGLHPAASFFAGAVLMFCGAHFLHIYAGHLPNLCAMIWAPLIFFSIDRFFEKRDTGSCLLGMFAVAMQIFAGHPQYVFYTAIAAGIYSTLRLLSEEMRDSSVAQRNDARWKSRAITAAGLLTIYPGGAALASVQLLTGAQATAETIRNESLPFEFAKMFAFPPENLLTLIAPDFFGDVGDYWGRCYLWEMSLFVGVTALVLAVYAICYGGRKNVWLLGAMVGLLFVLALGVHTPLFAVLYKIVPAFDKFRGISKFTFTMTLFLVALSATGLDRLFKQRKIEPVFVKAVFGFAVLLALLAVWPVNSAAWPRLMAAVHATGESYLPMQIASSATFAGLAQSTAFQSLFWAAGVCALLGGILLCIRRDSRAALTGVVVLGILEMLVFAYGSRSTFDSTTATDPTLKQFLAEHPGDYRILNPLNPNSALLLGARDVWGNDPGVVRRYAEFMAWTQGIDPNAATQYLSFQKLDPLYAMLRLRYAFVPQQNGMRVVEAPAQPLPRLRLISDYRVATNRDGIFSLMRTRDFDPRREMILEREPEPKPSGGDASGTANVVNETTDELTIEANLPQPAILLITDVYTPAWRAVPLAGSVQQHYDLQPANYTLRAVPLAAGHHFLRVEYAPRAFTIGKWISILAVIIYLAAWAWIWRKRIGLQSNRARTAIGQ